MLTFAKCMFFISSFTYSLSQCIRLKQVCHHPRGMCVGKVEPGSGMWCETKSPAS